MLFLYGYWGYGIAMDNKMWLSAVVSRHDTQSGVTLEFIQYQYVRYQTRLYPSLAGTEYVPSRSSIVLRELWSASQLGLRSIGCIPLILQCVIHESCQPYIQYSYRLLVRSTESRQIPQIPAITQLNHHTCLSFSGLFLSFILCIYASPTTIWYKLHTLHYIGVQIRTRTRTIAPDRVPN